MQGMSANSPLSSWVKALTSFSVLTSKLDHLPEEMYQLLGTVGESVRVHCQQGESGVQHTVLESSALQQMKSQKRSLPYCFPPCSPSIHQLVEE